MVPYLADRLARRVFLQLYVRPTIFANNSGAECTSADKEPEAYVAHCFSNGGFLALSAVIAQYLQRVEVAIAPKLDDATDQPNTQHVNHGANTGAAQAPPALKLPLRAVVFDSAPALITPDVVYRSVPLHLCQDKLICIVLLCTRCLYS
jgi:hypothetical protein